MRRNWRATRPFHVRDFGEPMSFSTADEADVSFSVADDEATDAPDGVPALPARLCCCGDAADDVAADPAGVLRLFVTGDWPDGDRLPPRYLRTEADGPLWPLDESSAPLDVVPVVAAAAGASRTVVVAATRCGSAVWVPPASSVCR